MLRVVMYSNECLTSRLLGRYTSFVSTSLTIKIQHRIGGVMVSVLASSAVDRGFEPR